MDSITIIIAIVSLLFGAILTFFLVPRAKKKTETNSNQSPKKDRSSVDKIISKDLLILQKELSKLKEELAESEDKVSEFERKKKYFEEDKILDSHQTNVEQLKKLDKETSQLKDDIEELEDDIEELQKKNKRIKGENNELDERVYIIEKEKKEISESNKKSLKELERVETENKKQKESLSFISDILNANSAINEKFQEVDQKTWDIYSFIKNDLKYSLDYLNNNFISDDFLDDCLSWRNQEIKTWIKHKKVVAIVGEFSAGKTSIVNRILKQDDPNAIELPVKSTETTAIPTYISNGVDFNCQFYSPSGDLKNISPESFQKVTKSVLDDINISSLIKYFVLSYNNKNLSDISILDTPGFGSNSDEIINKTTEVIKEADALFWVVDVNSGEINNTSINVINKNLQKVPLYIIINKSDDLSQDHLNEVKEKIEETLSKNSINYEQVIFFSNKHEIDELMDILNDIAPKISPKVITKVREQIKITLNKTKTSLHSLNKEAKELGCSRDNEQDKLEQVIQNIEYSIEDMDRVISKKEPFFGKDYYKIEMIDYGKFENGMNQILTSKKNLPTNINEFISNIEDHSKKTEETSEKKYFLDNLSKSEKTFLELVKDYNHELIN